MTPGRLLRVGALGLLATVVTLIGVNALNAALLGSSPLVYDLILLVWTIAIPVFTLVLLGGAIAKVIEIGVRSGRQE